MATPIMMQIPSENAFHVIGFWSYYIPGYSCSNTKTFFIKVARFSNWIKDTINQFKEDTIVDTSQESAGTDGFIDAIETGKYASLGRYTGWNLNKHLQEQIFIVFIHDRTVSVDNIVRQSREVLSRLFNI